MNWLEVEGFREALNRLPQRLNATVIADACDVNAGRFTERIATGVEQWPWPGSSMRSEHKADQNHPVVAMASILAKEERDRSLRALSQRSVSTWVPDTPATPSRKSPSTVWCFSPELMKTFDGVGRRWSDSGPNTEAVMSLSEAEHAPSNNGCFSRNESRIS